MNINSTHYFRLSFNEANILMENIKGMDKSTLVLRLKELSKTVSDVILKESTVSLLHKIANLTDEEFDKLKKEAALNHITYPPNFTLNN